MREPFKKYKIVPQVGMASKTPEAPERKSDAASAGHVGTVCQDSVAKLAEISLTRIMGRVLVENTDAAYSHQLPKLTQGRGCIVVPEVVSGALYVWKANILRDLS